MFETLTERLTSVFAELRRHGKLSEADVDVASAPGSATRKSLSPLSAASDYFRSLSVGNQPRYTSRSASLSTDSSAPSDVEAPQEPEARPSQRLSNRSRRRALQEQAPQHEPSLVHTDI